MRACLDPIFAPVGCYDMVRLGRDHDGGYLVDPRSVASAMRLVSFGMNDDWSFEAGFRALNQVPIDVYDYSVGRNSFMYAALSPALLIDRPRLLGQRIRTFAGYLSFFRGDRHHHRVQIGYDQPGSKSLSTVISDLSDSGHEPLFLKVDIEGFEHRILDQIVDHADRLEGLAIEFHDVDLHLDRIEAFLRRFPLNLCHIHANNHIRPAPNGVPRSLELSFSKYPPGSPTRPILPHPLDQPNTPANQEITFLFSAEQSG